jgi:hypothetical protein
MATRNQVLSLFGVSPQQIMEQQAQQQAQAVQAIRDPYQQVGTAIGVGLGRLLGGKSAEVMQAEQMQEALQGINPEDPAQLRELARTVQTFAPERSLQLLDRAMQIEDQGLARKTDELRLEVAKERLETMRGEKDEAARAKTNAINMFKNLDGGAPYASAIEAGLLDPSAAYKTFQEQGQLDVSEIQTYNDGTQEILAGVDSQGRVVQATPAGWQRVEGDWTQGKVPTNGSKDSIKPVGSTTSEMTEVLAADDDLTTKINALVTEPRSKWISWIPGIDDTTTDSDKAVIVTNEVIRRAKELQKNIPEGAERGLSAQEALNQALMEYKTKIDSTGNTNTVLTKDPKTGKYK